MSIQESDVIDIVSTNVERNEVILTISDHLSWDDSPQHQKILETKLNLYIQFVKGEDLEMQYPDAHGRTIVFRLVSKFRPDADGYSFIEKAATILKSIGIVFRSDMLSEA